MDKEKIYPSDLPQLLQHYQGPIAVDTETSGLHVDEGARASTISIAWLDNVGGERGTPLHRTTQPDLSTTEGDGIRSIAWPFDQGCQGTGKPEDDGQGTMWPDAENLPAREWDTLLEFLHNWEHGIIMHHAKFDLHILRAGLRTQTAEYGRGRDLAHRVTWDTQNIADLLWGWRWGTTSLKPTAQRELGTEADNEQQIVKEYLRRSGLPNGRWDLIPWDVIGPYADQDARITLALWRIQQESIRRGGAKWLGNPNQQDLAIQRRLDTSKMLYRLEERGMPFDVDGAREAAREVQARAEDRKKELPFQPATIAAAKRYWFDGRRAEVYDTTATGQPKLDALTVSKLAADGVHGAETWQQIQQLQTADQRWYSGWTGRAGRDNRIRTSIRQNGTVSGRFSAENIQLQAIPHDYRLAGAALHGIPTPRELISRGIPDGMQLWELDLAQAELRVAALYAGCDRMLELIHAGADLHGQTAKDLFGVDENHREWGRMRTIAKRANFSFLFGVGADTFQDALEQQTGTRLRDIEAREIVTKWNGIYPEYRRAIDRASASVKTRARTNEGYGWVSTWTGERRWFSPGEDLHKAFNQAVQANLAQFALSWWLESDLLVDRALAHPSEMGGGRYRPVQRGGAGVVLTVHDSIVLLLPERGGAEIVQQVVDAGVTLWERAFPGVPGGVDAKPWKGGE